MKVSGPAVQNMDLPKYLHDHSHQWELTDCSPVFEDDAAIFYEECTFVEIYDASYPELHDEAFIDEGKECDSEREFRMELTSVTKKRTDAPDITFLASEDRFADRIEAAKLDAIESGVITDAVPLKRTGHVILESTDWRVRYDA